MKIKKLYLQNYHVILVEIQICVSSQLEEVMKCETRNVDQHIDGLMQERRNSIANALELRLSCTNPSM